MRHVVTRLAVLAALAGLCVLPAAQAAPETARVHRATAAAQHHIQAQAQREHRRLALRRPAAPAPKPRPDLGERIARVAQRYLGAPYVYGGASPSGFDCSGFVMFVIRNVLGRNITHDMFVQYDLGTPVARGNLQPGDIVFFQNTFRWGMSHNGIYIGNGQFVHAENENTGVKISDINSQYYSSRYYGAVRFA
jgi:cell wall-associated NlpC family hydrolase